MTGKRTLVRSFHHISNFSGNSFGISMKTVWFSAVCVFC